MSHFVSYYFEGSVGEEERRNLLTNAYEMQVVPPLFGPLCQHPVCFHCLYNRPGIDILPMVKAPDGRQKGLLAWKISLFHGFCIFLIFL